MKWKKTVRIAGRIVLLCVVCAFIYFVCMVGYLLTPAGEASINRGLAEEKSYVKHAGTYYRMRRELWGQKGNFETWDEAEQIVGVVKAKGPKGVWAAWSNELNYMPQALRLDPGKRAMCVIHLNENVYVVRGVKRRVARCEAVQPGFGVSDVRSGELVPSSDRIAEIYFERIEGPAQNVEPPAGKTP